MAKAEEEKSFLTGFSFLSVIAYILRKFRKASTLFWLNRERERVFRTSQNKKIKKKLKNKFLNLKVENPQTKGYKILKKFKLSWMKLKLVKSFRNLVTRKMKSWKILV